MKKVSILIPSYNEEQSLPLLYNQLVEVTNNLAQYEWEFMFVNDGSRDNTLNVIQQLREQDNRVNYVDLSRNFGKEVAMLAGFDYVTGDCVVIMDADLQHPPYVIEEFIKKWEEGYEDVYAIRRTRGKESFIRKKLSLTYYKLLQHSTRVEVLPNVGDFRLLDRKCINMLRQMRDQERYTKGMYCWIGCRKIGVEFEQGDRQEGESKWNFSSLLNLAINGITSFTIAPLRMVSVAGIIIASLAFIYMVYVIIKAIIYGDPVAGFPSLMVAILFLGGVQLIGLGILGEYVGRIFNESKNRPVYFIESFNGEYHEPNQ
ncbi:MAG: glycosyltransferase family 2 protein [Rikenellaceae bacterium]|nr:glycosyltransferase family 2 protein [Rikenellaceae bacterium]